MPRRHSSPLILLLYWATLTGCDGESAPPSDASSESDPGETTVASSAVADVTAVEVSGDAEAYTFAVTVKSPDTGCDQYANWWEVLDADGMLLYRRILGHSHVNEQPFQRSGGPVAIEPSTRVFVRAHLFPQGYGGAVWEGSVDEGFAPATDVAPDFGAEVPIETPDCAH